MAKRSMKMANRERGTRPSEKKENGKERTRGMLREIKKNGPKTKREMGKRREGRSRVKREGNWPRDTKKYGQEKNRKISKREEIWP